MEEKRLKMAVIAGASKALKHKQKNPFATESEIIQMITKEAREIIKNIDTFDK